MAALEAKVAALAELVRRKRQQEAQAEAAAEAVETVENVENVQAAQAIEATEATEATEAVESVQPVEAAEVIKAAYGGELEESDFDEQLDVNTHSAPVSFTVNNPVTPPMRPQISILDSNTAGTPMQVDDGRAGLTNSIHTYSPNKVEASYGQEKCASDILSRRGTMYSIPCDTPQPHMVPTDAHTTVGNDKYTQTNGMPIAAEEHHGGVCIVDEIGPGTNSITNDRGIGDSGGGRVVHRMTATTLMMDHGAMNTMGNSTNTRRPGALLSARRKEEQFIVATRMGPRSEGGADSEHETLLLNSDMSAATLPLRMLPMTHTMSHTMTPSVGVGGTDVPMQGGNDQAYGFGNELDDFMDMSGQRIFSC